MNPVALITGGSRGIGRGIALELAAAGFDLLINFAGNHAAAEATSQSCTEKAFRAGKTIKVEKCQADISRGEERRKLIDACDDLFGRLDILINNAGVAPTQRMDILEANEESFDRLMSINVKGPYFLTQLAANYLIRQGVADKSHSSIKPKIITISSLSSYAASTNRGDYCIAKAALSMLTPLYAARLAEHGIQTFEIRPGIIETDMTAPVKEKYDKLIAEGLTPFKRWGTPEDVGKAIVAIATDSFPFSTGEVINVDGGFHFRRL